MTINQSINQSINADYVGQRLFVNAFKRFLSVFYALKNRFLIFEKEGVLYD